MEKNRKKVEKKPVNFVGPKKRVEPKTVSKGVAKKRPEPIPEPPKVKKPKVEDKYVRIADDAKQDEFKVIGDRVQAGELKWAYYALDTNKGYHHYIVLPIKIIK